MKISLQIVSLLNILKLCVCAENLWHPYHHDPIHRSREELVITNITSVDFKLDYIVPKWKSLHVETTCFMAGITEKTVVIVSFKLNNTKDGFVHNSFTIDLESKPVDVALFQYWNIKTQEPQAVAVVATQEPQLLWYKISTNSTLFWSWPMVKPIKHLNVFQIEYSYHLLVVEERTASVYEFAPNAPPDFWLGETLELSNWTTSSAAITVGPDTYLALPQKNSLQIYKFRNSHFEPYKNLSSPNITEVIAFKIGQKAFLAFNGLHAGIYRFARKDLEKETVAEKSHLDGVNYWLPISLTVYGDDTILVAQRCLNHGGHKSFVVDIFTYNGERFEEHEDVPCNYFGEETGLSCLPDEEAQRGIQGSVSVFLGNVLGVVVPRKNRPSDLFLLRKEVRKITNPLEKQIEEFEARKTTISKLIEAQEERYREVEAREAMTPLKIKEELDTIEEDLKEMNEFMALEAGTPRHFEVAVFNDLVKVESSGTFDEVKAVKLNSEPVETVLDDIVLRNNLQPIGSTKTFTSLQVEDLIATTINDALSSEFLFKDRNVTFDGDLFLNKPLTVFNDLNALEINGLVFQEEVIDLESPVEELAFQNLEISGDISVEKINHRHVKRSEGRVYEAFFIPRNVQVVNINGEDFNEFLKGLCFTNVDNYIPGSVQITGDVKVLGDATVELLNGLQFPEEYVFVDGSLPEITGKKNFTSLTTKEFNCDGTIDNIPASNLITLSSDQEIPGTTTFKNLKITESLQVDGNITGEHASKFLPNPTLLETSFVKSKVQFQNLQVQGSIIVNDKTLEEKLSDIVYVSEEKPVIEAMKQFPDGFTVGNLFVGSKSINNVSLDSIVTKDTDQVLDLVTITGDVTFGSVKTGGLYNSFDVKKLDEELVKLSGEQYVSSTLIFEDEVEVAKLVVIDSIKKEESHVKSVVVEGNFFGEIEGFNLAVFDQKKMSFNEDQTIEPNFTLQKSFVGTLESDRINGVDEEEYRRDTWSQRLEEQLKEGKLEVKDFHATTVDVGKINNNLCSFGGSFWSHDLKRHNLTNLTFTGEVSFDHVEVEKLSGVNFQKFLNNIVFKNETDVTISGRKTFLQGLYVKKLIETKKLNNVSLSNILTRHGEQEISGPLTVSGDVVFANVTVLLEVNQVPVGVLQESYNADGRFTVTGDVLFKRMPHIQHLHLEGFVNDRKAQEVIDGIVYTDDDFKLRGLITFENKINMDKNIRVKGKVNGIDLPAFVSDMVMVTKDTTIKSNMRFTEEVVADAITVNNLTSEDLNGVDVRAWGKRAVLIDRGFLKGTYQFEDVTVIDSLHTRRINDFNMQNLIPLRTQESLPQLTVKEMTLFNDAKVGNSVNFRNFPQEFDNTVLISTEQEIDSDIEFDGNVFIEHDVEVLGSLNGVDTNRIVTTNTDQDLEAVYRFASKVNLEDLSVDLINGIDVNKWEREAVKTSSEALQNITDNWEIEHELVFEDDCIGDALINEIDFRKFSDDVEEKRNYKYEVERGFIDDYTNICKDLKYMYDKMKRQIYKFDYLEALPEFNLNFQQKVQHVYFFENQKNAFLIVNEKKNCQSHLFIFDSHFRYVRDVHFGFVAQIVKVHDRGILYLVVRNQDIYSSCKVQGTHIWEVKTNGDVVNLAIVEEQDLLQESLEPATFYGLQGQVVTEFKIISGLGGIVRKYRKWRVNEDNIAFVPRGLATGLAVRTGRKLIKLHRDPPASDEFSLETEEIIIGNYTEAFNTYFPGRNDGDFVVMKAGIRSNKRNLLAVASHEETSVKGSLDFIKIYEDTTTGKVFHKVATYKPSSLLSLEFHNGETLLAFMEDERILQIYEYKGIEGFKHKSSTKLSGSQLFTFSLQEKKIVGVVDKKRILFMQIVMLGNQMNEDVQCSL